MTKRNRVLWAVAVAVIAAVVVFRGQIPFDWTSFWSQLRHVRLANVAVGLGLIYTAMVLRAARWAVFVAPTKRVSALDLVGPQFVGFTAVALFGRLADLTRPYLVAKKIGLPVASQVAVYTIERMFDLGAAALIFSTALAFTPGQMPHHEILVRTGLVSLALTFAIGVFAIVVRVSGGALAGFARGTLGRLSRPLGDGVAEKLMAFRDGLNALSSMRDFGLAAAASLLMWGMIGEAYVQTAHAFVQTPELAELTFSRTMLLMGASIGSSVLQLPVIGWFTQIGVTATAMHQMFGAPVEAATACGALLLAVNLLSVIPVGLVFARVERVGLKAAARESEEATAKEQGGERAGLKDDAAGDGAGSRAAARIDTPQ